MHVDLLLTAWMYAALLMLVLWFVQARYKNASYVDIGWTLGLLCCASVYVTGTGELNTRKLLLIAMVAIWAFRLSALLVGRLMRDPSEDSRYARIRADWKTHQNFKFFLMFQFQGFLDVVLSIGFLLIALNPSEELRWIEYLALTLWIIGFIGETIADAQLKAFKADPSNKGKTCQAGLWRYSRHPNYFFEWLMWLAYFVMAQAAPWGILAVVMPVLMYYFLMHVSGVPLAEAQALKTKGEEYRQYQRSTSIFVPLPKRKI